MAAMDRLRADQAVQQLVLGFETLQEEYQTLHEQHQALERKLATAREQYNELAKLCGSGNTATPPLSLSSSPGHKQREDAGTQPALQILRDGASKDAVNKVENAAQAAQSLRQAVPRRPNVGVRIWSGPSADRQDVGSSTLHSISESPLEQDFTVEGKPSKLGCPFASMANKKLSSHAASVLSRYKSGGTDASGSQFGSDAVRRVHGNDSGSRQSSRRASIVDPIKAEICGLSDHRDDEEPRADQAAHPNVENAESGVCPIRFLDQHSPEEVATYFEKHKHELPRSHEVCVKRYQSNELQIRQLDEKYGNLVSMIQGLGAKHKDMLPADPDDEEGEGENAEMDEREAAKVRKWASSIVAQAGEDKLLEVEAEDEDVERKQHFERPLRDIRVGESPSRPWGISVPPKYLEQEGSSETSSRPARVATTSQGQAAPDETAPDETAKKAAPPTAAKGRCPFGFDQTKAEPQKEAAERPPAPAFLASEAKPAEPPRAQGAVKTHDKQQAPMVFSGPVFVGYSAEDAAKILRQSGLGGKS